VRDTPEGKKAAAAAFAALATAALRAAIAAAAVGGGASGLSSLELRFARHGLGEPAVDDGCDWPRPPETYGDFKLPCLPKLLSPAAAGLPGLRSLTLSCPGPLEWRAHGAALEAIGTLTSLRALALVRDGPLLVGGEEDERGPHKRYPRLADLLYHCSPLTSLTSLQIDGALVRCRSSADTLEPFCHLRRLVVNADVYVHTGATWCAFCIISSP